MSAGRRARTPSTRVEGDLVSAAEAVVSRDGLAGLTVRAVAAEAEIAPMALYSRLGGKVGLITALQLRGFARLRTAIEAADGETPRARLRACCLRYRDFALENPRLYMVLFAGADPRERPPSAVAERAEDCLSVLVRNVELEAALGGFPSADPRASALGLWSAMHGAVTLELTGLLPTRDPAATYRAFLETVLR